MNTRRYSKTFNQNIRFARCILHKLTQYTLHAFVVDDICKSALWEFKKKMRKKSERCAHRNNGQRRVGQQHVHVFATNQSTCTIFAALRLLKTSWQISKRSNFEKHTYKSHKLCISFLFRQLLDTYGIGSRLRQWHTSQVQQRIWVLWTKNQFLFVTINKYETYLFKISWMSERKRLVRCIVA